MKRWRTKRRSHLTKCQAPEKPDLASQPTCVSYFARLYQPYIAQPACSACFNVLMALHYGMVLGVKPKQLQAITQENSCYRPSGNG